MFQLLASLLAACYSIVPNFAVAITLMTLVVMLILTPITLKGTRSMLAMQKLQPEMKRLQEEHKGDKAAQNEAMVAFYKEHKVNPLSGCLPMIAQMPVMIVMFRVFLGLVKMKTVDGQQVATPAYLKTDTALSKAIVNSHGKMVSFGVDFARKAAAGGPEAFPVYLLIALVVVTGYWQVRQMQARNTSAAANPQAQMMTKVMPLFSGLISFTLPGGVTLYFLISNLFRIAQQSLMYRFDPNLRASLPPPGTREVKSRTALRETIGSARNGNRATSRNGNGDGASANKSRPVTTGRVSPAGRPAQGRKRKRRR